MLLFLGSLLLLLFLLRNMFALQQNIHLIYIRNPWDVGLYCFHKILIMISQCYALVHYSFHMYSLVDYNSVYFVGILLQYFYTSFLVLIIFFHSLP
jgi:hypothetical protein